MTPKFITNNDTLIAEVAEFIAEWQRPSTSIIVNTSGSTGTPKSIEIEKSHMIASAEMTGHFFQLEKGQRVLMNLSPKTIGGIMLIVRAIVLELELIVIDVTSTPLIHVNEYIDFAAMVPMQVESCIKECPDKFNLIKTLIIGGGKISINLEKKLNSLNCEVYHTFGMTETISHIALRNVKTPVSEFQVLEGVEIESINSCLVINAPSIGVSKLKTNDLVELTSKTSFKWLGRSDFAINSGGIKIIPTEIESQLEGIIQGNFFSIGIPDQKLGQKHILVLERNSEYLFKKSDFEILAKYTIPKEVYFLDKFIYTTSGKIDKLQTIDTLNNAKKQVL